MITNLATIPAVPMTRPGYLEPFIDRFGSKLTRICGDAGASLSIGGDWFTDSRHKYSKRQPWNDDEAYLLLDQRGGDPRKLIVDGFTYAPLWSDRDQTKQGKLLKDSYEVQWRPGYVEQMVSTTRLTNGLGVAIWRVTDGEILWETIIPSEDPNFGWAGEGQISDDGRWTCFSTRLPEPQANTNEDYLVVVDLARGKVGPRTPIRYATTAFPTSAKGLIGNCGISPRGMFAEVKLSGTEQYGFILDVDQDNLIATPHMMSVDGLRMGPPEARGGTGASLGAIAWMSHPDMNVDTANFEVVVGGVRGMDQSNSDPNGSKRYGNVISVDLLTGRHRHVSPGEAQLGGMRAASMQHGSGRAHKRRGWHLISTEITGGWGAGEIQWVLLDQERKIERLCVHRSDDSKTGGGYRAEAHPVASPSGRAVLYASNWGGDPSMADVKGYVATQGDGAPPPPPNLPRFWVDPLWTYSPPGAVIDRSTGKLVPLQELADAKNKEQP